MGPIERADVGSIRRADVGPIGHTDMGAITTRDICRNISKGGGGGRNLGYGQKRGGGQKLMWGATPYTYWGGGGWRMTQRGENAPPCLPLKYVQP